MPRLIREEGSNRPEQSLADIFAWHIQTTAPFEQKAVLSRNFEEDSPMLAGSYCFRYCPTTVGLPVVLSPYARLYSGLERWGDLPQADTNPYVGRTRCRSNIRMLKRLMELTDRLSDLPQGDARNCFEAFDVGSYPPNA